MAQDEPLGAERPDAAPQDAAAEAFEQLRGEVAQLRAAVEALPDRLEIRAPDYAPTLGEIMQRLQAIEGHPALQYTPEGFRAENRANLEVVQRGLETEAQRALTVIGHASAEVRRFAGDLRSRAAQRNAVLYGVGGGLVGGAVLWALLAGPVARTLPASWRVPERMAAATLHTDMWAAGGQLMEAANPSAWRRAIAAAQFWQDNHAALEACVRSAERANRPFPCRVTVAPPAAGKG